MCSYKTGLEKLPSAAYHFRMSISKEFRYRHVLHWGRVVKKRCVQPLQHAWRESKGKRGFGRNALTPRLEAELPRLKDCQLFHWPALQALIERASSGAFINSHALEQLLTAAVIDAFLFGSGFSGERALHCLEPSREISNVNPNCDLRLRQSLE
jgi:hypothetical protein